MLKWTINQIRKAPQPFVFSEEIRLDELLVLRDDIEGLSPIQVDGTIAIRGEDQFAIKMTITGRADLLAANNLAIVPFPFTIEVNANASSKYHDQDEDVVVISDHEIDLQEFVYGLVDIELPTHITSSEKSNIPQEGAHWKISDEAPKKDSPFAQLRQLIEDDEKKK